MTITIPIKPLSVNNCWQGRRFKTREYTQYQRDVSILLMPYRNKKYEGDVRVFIRWYLKSVLRMDIDNPCKPLLDILVKNGIIRDDRNVQELHLYKVKSEKEYIVIDIDNVDSK